MDTAQTSAVTQRTLPQPFNKTGLKTEVVRMSPSDSAREDMLMPFAPSEEFCNSQSTHPSQMCAHLR